MSRAESKYFTKHFRMQAPSLSERELLVSARAHLPKQFSTVERSASCAALTPSYYDLKSLKFWNDIDCSG